MLQFLFSPTKQFLYDSGKLLAGGKIFVYVKDTSNLAELYNVEDELVSNPIILDANGRASVKADDTYEYRLEIYTPYDTLLYTANAFYAGGGEGGGGEFIVRHDITLSGAGTSQSPLGVINIPLAVDETLTSRVDDVEGTEAMILGVNGDWFNSTFGCALSSKLDISSFNSYSADMQVNLSTKLDTSSFDLSDYYNKTEVDLLLGDKVDNDTFTNVVQNLEESKENKIEYSYNGSNQITGINNSAIAGGEGIVFPITGTDGTYNYSASMNYSGLYLNSNNGNGRVLRLNNEYVGLYRYMLGTISATWVDILNYSKMPTISSVALTTSTTAYYWNNNNLSGLNEVHITTPRVYDDAPSTYYVSFADEGFNIASGCKVDFIKQNVEGTLRWCVANSSTYKV